MSTEVTTTVITDYDRFTPILQANLCIPSAIHGYSIGTEYIQNWFLSKFKKNYFKTFHLNGKHVMDDFRKFEIGEFAKRIKPAAILTPQFNLDFDNDLVDLYQGDTTMLLRRGGTERAFFRDHEKNLFLAMKMKGIQMQFNFRVIVSTKAQQADLYNRMQLLFRVGSTQGKYIEIDFHLPKEILLNIAKQTGFKIEKTEICDNFAFLRYLNSHSEIPITYKLRKINGNTEYFMRYSNVYAHINNTDKLSADDGNTSGMLSSNFSIEMNVILDIQTPAFFMFFNRDPLEYELDIMEATEVSVYSIKFVEIPEVNSKGWDQFIKTQFLVDSDGVSEIDISELFDGESGPNSETNQNTYLNNMIRDSINSFLSPSMFMDVAVYNNILGATRLETKMDWENMKIILPENLESQKLYITIYLDKLYVNEKVYEKRELEARIKE